MKDSILFGLYCSTQFYAIGKTTYYRKGQWMRSTASNMEEMLDFISSGRQPCSGYYLFAEVAPERGTIRAKD
jgi:hypothetical protein